MPYLSVWQSPAPTKEMPFSEHQNASDHWATHDEPLEAIHAAEGAFMAEVSNILHAMDGDPTEAMSTISHSHVLAYLDAALAAKLKVLHPYATAAQAY